MSFCSHGMLQQSKRSTGSNFEYGSGRVTPRRRNIDPTDCCQPLKNQLLTREWHGLPVHAKKKIHQHHIALSSTVVIIFFFRFATTMKFSLLALSVLSSLVNADNSNALRSSNESRRLSFEKIAGYAPGSQVCIFVSSMDCFVYTGSL